MNQMPDNSSQPIDIFGLISDSAKKEEKNEEKERQERRKEMLEPTGVKEVFKEGKISINPYTCVGVQCKYCINACPTNALYWSNEGVKIIEDLCVYCGACVMSCMVDDCIQVERKRKDGTTEKFGKIPKVVSVNDKRNSQKSHRLVTSFFQEMRAKDRRKRQIQAKP